MPITYTWTPTSLIGYPTFDGQTDVVTRANYTVLGDDGEGHTANYSNFAYTPLDPSVPFIPYVDLTPEIVTKWIQSALGPDAVAAIEENIAISIQRQVTPPPEPEVLPLPWIQPAAPQVTVTVTASSPSLTESPVVIEPPAPDTSAPVN
jgi:hypothetical protein